MKKQNTIIYIDNLVNDSKKFLHKLRSTQEDETQPSGLKIQFLNKAGEKHNTLIYEQQVYVVVVPHGEKEEALLYGNWDEALKASQKLLYTELSSQKGHHLTVTAYNQVI